MSTDFDTRPPAYAPPPPPPAPEPQSPLKRAGSAIAGALALIVELDSREFHDTAEAFERDRLRDAELQLAGYAVLRITWRQLTRHPARVAATLRRGLDLTAHHHGDDRLRRGRTVGTVASRGPR